eukprot:CAMPEP_0194412192 /NCGR_PEP_ID=MMETSP0176-20130528/10614_1 /TAXON_ID=216777 /ORGANISM="Proboscia alata, Strain PI-D3" /LENGTH=58 /DNA_ID=CAMNT_0039214785 /DNA_START=30 /DNA_END=206 /DNA_ORIENTATION=-
MTHALNLKGVNTRLIDEEKNLIGKLVNRDILTMIPDPVESVTALDSVPCKKRPREYSV